MAFRELPLPTKSRIPTENWQCNTILIGTKHPKLKRSSKTYRKPTPFCQTLRNEDSTTRWATRDSINATRPKTSSGAQTSNRYSETSGFNFGFGDLFGTIFGQHNFEERATRGRDLGYDMEITLEEAAHGTEKEIEFRRIEKCDVCGGTGAAPGTSPRTCPNCKGAGRIQKVNRSNFGTFVQVVPCSTCRGQGKIIDSQCPMCRGTGLMRKQRKITVKVPPGIDEGYQLRLQGQGEMAPESDTPGDLYALIHIAPHSYFKRDEDDLLYDLQIGFPQAALGARVSVPTLDGNTDMDVPAGTQPGQIIRLRGRGMPKFRGYGRGDLLLRIEIVVPEKLTQQQRTLLEELAKEFDQTVRPKSHRLRF